MWGRWRDRGQSVTSSTTASGWRSSSSPTTLLAWTQRLLLTGELDAEHVEVAQGGQLRKEEEVELDWRHAVAGTGAK
jgi:hypothetical protein